MTKICSKCKQEKQFPEEFAKGSYIKKDGSNFYYSHCKECYNKKQRDRKLELGKIKTQPFDTPSENLIGKNFGRLKVIQHAGRKQLKHRKKHMWLCECYCGNKITIDDNSLKTKNTRSCGCSRNEIGENSPRYKGFNKISGSFWSTVKYKARCRNIEFDITIEYAWMLFEKQNGKCALSKLDLYFVDRTSKSSNKTASLDRIDSSKGYIKGNVQWLHKYINIMKNSHTQEDFILLCKNVVDNNS